MKIRSTYYPSSSSYVTSVDFDESEASELKLNDGTGRVRVTSDDVTLTISHSSPDDFGGGTYSVKRARTAFTNRAVSLPFARARANVSLSFIISDVFAEPKPELFKLYCVVSMEAMKKMNGVRGKFGAQAGHAYLHAFWDSEKHFPDYAEAYKDSERAFKICVSVPTDADLVSLQRKYASICGTSLTVDAGLTVFNEPTVTTLGIGPVPDSLVEDTLRDLKPLT